MHNKQNPGCSCRCTPATHPPPKQMEHPHAAATRGLAPPPSFASFHLHRGPPPPPPRARRQLPSITTMTQATTDTTTHHRRQGRPARACGGRQQPRRRSVVPRAAVACVAPVLLALLLAVAPPHCSGYINDWRPDGGWRGAHPDGRAAAAAQRSGSVHYVLGVVHCIALAFAVGGPCPWAGRSNASHLPQPCRTRPPRALQRLPPPARRPAWHHAGGMACLRACLRAVRHIA